MLRSGRRLLHSLVDEEVGTWSRNNTTGIPAFSFDIDGVLVRGKDVLSEARRAFELLYEKGGERPKFPVCFLTNGGGCLESEKAQELSSWLNVNVTAEQVVLSHSPMRALAQQYGDRPVLIAGRGHILKVAREYGFRKSVTTGQLGSALEKLGATPLSRYYVVHQCSKCKSLENVSLLREEERNCQHLGTTEGEGCPVHDEGIGSALQPFEAVLVMIDPVEWGRDIQLVVDVLNSHGAPLDRSLTLASRAAQVASLLHRPSVPVFFSNPDIIWANHFHLHRLGQGAFAIALEAVYKETTGHPIPRKYFFGKPNPVAYRCAEDSLLAQAKSLFGVEAVPLDEVDAEALRRERADASSSAHGAGGWSFDTAFKQKRKLPFSYIFHVGDNPSADVLGAIQAGDPWRAVLVRTGVYQEGVSTHLAMHGGTAGAHIVVDHVLDAVRAGLHRARSKVWHSMR